MNCGNPTVKDNGRMFCKRGKAMRNSEFATHKSAFAIFGVVLLSLISGVAVSAQSSPPTLSSDIHRFAWFGCNSMTINGTTKVCGVPSVGGTQGLGGHVGTNGNMVVNGSNTIAGNAYYGPGKTITVNGASTQVQGSRIQMSETLACRDSTVSQWTSYASATNLNAQVSTTYLDSSRNFKLNGSKSCTLAAGFYYFNNVTVNGSASLTAGGPVTIVCTGTVTINGNAKVNQGGDPSNLTMVVSSSSTVTLNGNAKVSADVFAPLAEINVNGNIIGYGSLWGKTFSGNGSVVWNRVNDSTAPSIGILNPANGTTETTATPQVSINYSDGQNGTGLDRSTLSIKIDGTEISPSLTIGDLSATGVPPFDLTEGSHTLVASIRDYDGNEASATSTFNVALSSTDTIPPAIAVSGAIEGGLYGSSVMPVIVVTDEHLDPLSVLITLDGAPFVSGTTVSSEGSHLLHVAASDTFGNHSELNVNFSLDLAAPVITVTGIAEGGVYGIAVTPVVTVEDVHLDTASVTATLNSQPFVSGTPVTEDGAYTLEVSASDTLGHSSHFTAAFTLDSQAPVISVAGVSEAGIYGQSVTPEITITDPQLDQATVVITLNGASFVSGTPVTEDNSYILSISASDTLGHSSNTSINFSIDLGAPVITVSGVTDGGVYADAVTPAVTVTDPQLDQTSVVVTLDGEPFTGGTPVSTEGDHILHLYAADTLGHTANNDVKFALDYTPPEISISGIADGSTYDAPVTPVITVTDPHLDATSTTMTLDGEPYTSGTEISAEGSHTIAVSAVDTVGHTASSQTAFIISYYHAPPTISITGIENGAWYNHDVIPVITLTGDFVDPSKTSVTLNSEAYVSETPVTAENFYLLFVSAENTYGGKSQATLYFVIDKTAPVITVTEPYDNAAVGTTPVSISGRIDDISPESLAVNGESVTLSGGGDFTVSRTLAEGANTFAFVATDKAQNTGSLEWHVSLKTTKPTITITSPQNGIVTAASYVDVEGTVSSDTIRVFVGSEQAVVRSGSFSYPRYAIAEGSNTITARAVDAAGNEKQTSVTVVKDTASPRIKIDSPKDDSHTTAGSVTVTGSITDASSATVAINGESVSLDNGVFTKQVSLIQGTNIISVSAEDAAGNRSENSVSMVMESGEFSVAGTSPAAGETDVSTLPEIRVSFNREVKASTLTSASFNVSANGTAKQGALIAEGNAVRFVPSSSFAEGASVNVNLTSAITDLAGTSLVPAGFTFTVLSSAPQGIDMVLDAIPTVTNSQALEVSGITGPGASVSIVVNQVTPVQITAGSDGTFSSNITLVQNQMNIISVSATLGGETAAASAAVVHDGTAPEVVEADFTESGMTITFSEPVDILTIAENTVLLAENDSLVTLALDITDMGTVLEIIPATPIGSSPSVLTLTDKIKDLAGNPLTSYTKSFNGAQTAGSSYILGEVFDDASGLPLSSVPVTLIKGGSSSAVSGSAGTYALPASTGEVVVRIGGSPLSTQWRKADVGSGSLQKIMDARLTSLSGESKTAGTTGATLQFLSGEVSIVVPENCFTADSTISVTKLGPQSLPFPLPYGFSPYACYRVDCALTPQYDITMKAAVTASGTEVQCAYFDEAEAEWIGLSPAAYENGIATAIVPANALTPSGHIVFLNPDTQPQAPPTVVQGQAVTGVSAIAWSAPAATLATDPSEIAPTGKASATALITPAEGRSSGVPFEARFVESLDIRDGSSTVTRSFSPYSSDIVAYQDGNDPLKHKAQFPVSPYPGIDVITLVEGRINIDIGAYSDTALGGGIIGTAGGTVTGMSGSSVTIQPSAASGSIPVRIVPVSLSSIMTTIPQDYEFLYGAELSLGGSELNIPAIIEVETGSLAHAVAETDTVLVVRAELVGGVYSLTIKDFAYLESGKLRTSSGSAVFTGLQSFTWQTVKTEGKYLFLRAKNPLSFTTGRVLAGSSPVSKALCGIATAAQAESAKAKSRKEKVNNLVREGKAEASALEIIDFTSLTYLTNETGIYLIPFALGTAEVKAVDVAGGDTGSISVTSSTAGEVLSRDITLSPVPLTVVSTYPANGEQGVSLAAQVIINFSKTVSAGSLTGSAVEVKQNGETMPGSMGILSGGSAVVWTPSEAYAEAALIQVTVSGVTDRFGNTLASPYTFSFTARSADKPKLDVGKIEAYVNTDGTMCARGGAGSVAGNGIVYLENLSHPEYGTVTVDANSDGSFELCIQGVPSDGIKLHTLSSTGYERTYTFKQFASADGGTVYIGAEGGNYSFTDGGGNLLGSIEVAEGTFDSFAAIGVKAGNAADMATTPDGFAVSAPVEITIDGTPGKGIRVSLPLPAGMNGTDFWLTRSVKWNNPEQISPMFIDKMDVVNYKGSQCLMNRCDEFPGVTSSGVYQVYGNPAGERAEDTLADWGFMTGQFIEAGYYSQVVVNILGLTPFVYLMDTENSDYRYYLVIPPDAAGPYELTFSDPSTGETIISETHTEIPTPTTPADLGISTNVNTRPYPTNATPFRVVPFDVPEVKGQFTDPRISYDLKFGTPAELTVTGAYGLIEYSESEEPLRARIEIGAQSVYADVLPNGSFIAVIPASSISSGLSVKVYDPEGAFIGELQDGIPEKQITQGMTLKISGGNISLGFGEGMAGKTGALFNSQDRLVSPVVFPYKALADEEVTTGSDIQAGDVLYLAMKADDIDVKDDITITFDSELPAVPAPLNSVNDAVSENSVRLKDDSGTVVPINVRLNGGKVLQIIPRNGLSSGKSYELSFYGLSGNARKYPLQPPVTFRFGTYGGAYVGGKTYTHVYDMVRRGSVLYMALGEEGYDIADVSNPATPATLVNGPVATFGFARGVDVAEEIPIKEGSNTLSRNVMVLVGGGASQPGWINLYYADEQDQENGQLQPIGTMIGGAGLSPAASQGGGAPTAVKAAGTVAVAATLSKGLQLVDLTKIQEQAQSAVITEVNKVMGTDGIERDISCAITGLGILPIGTRRLAVGALQNYGVGVWEITGGASLNIKGLYEIITEIHREQYPCLAVPAGARVAILDSYKRLVEGVEEKEATHYAFIAGGSQGLFIYKIENSGNIDLVGRIPLTDCFQVAVDKERRLAYAADGANGIAVVDISDPIQRDNICVILDTNGDGTDDRILARIPVSDLGSETTLIVDSDTGLLYTGQYSVDPSKSGLAVAGARIPRMEFLLEDTANPGKYKVAQSYLSAFDEDQPKLALWMNGGAGTTISDNTITLFDRKGFEEEAAKNSQGTPVPTTVERTGVVLARKSQKKTDKDYNLYIQQDKTTLMMNYDPAKENPMVTKQGGTLKGEVSLNGGSGYGPNGWAGTVEVSKPVARPWVEWVYNKPVTSQTERVEDSSSNGETSSHTYFPLNEEREVKLRVHKIVGGAEVAPDKDDMIKITAEPAGAVEGLPVTVPFTKSIFKVKALDAAQTFKYKYEFVENNADGGEQEAQCFTMELAMDYNRDGNIDDADFTASDDKKTYLFWVNNDKDVANGDEEDDEKVTDESNDSSDITISCKRDLEDFTRLQIRVDDETANKKIFSYYFKIVPEGGTTPSVNLFEAVKWNQFYIHPDPNETSLINGQLKKQKLAQVINTTGDGEMATIDSQANGLDNICPYLFEGKTAGKGKIVLTIKGKDQQGNEVNVYTRETTIELKDISKFYDKYVLGISDANYDNDLPDATASHEVTTEYTGDSDEYTLFVHGFNWEDYKKIWYSDTVFKRLWWQGYKGRMGLFMWPCRKFFKWEETLIFLEEYDRSDVRALRSAEGLRKVLADLKPCHKLHVLAHSQGNVVVGEALRQWTEGGTLVDSYIAAQAAIPGHCYDANADPMTEHLARESQIWTGYQTPNIYAYYPSGCAIEPCSSPPSYFADNYQKAGKIYNYFNRMDWVLGVWMWDQRTKPDLHYHYHDKVGGLNTYEPNTGDPKQGDRFYYDSLIWGDERTLSFEAGDERFIIMSRCAESRSLSLGQVTISPSGFHSSFDLEHSGLEYESDMYSHAREFRSDVIAEWPFWEQLKLDFGFTN